MYSSNHQFIDLTTTHIESLPHLLAANSIKHNQPRKRLLAAIANAN